MADEKELDQLRERIDRLDRQIQELINERVTVAKSIAGVKSRSGSVAYYRPEREAQILRRIIDRNTGPVSDAEMARLFREIMSVTLAAEAPIRVAFLGPNGTYTHGAAMKHFGHSVETLAQTTIDEVFRAVERGEAQYGVVPVENSTEGVVTHTLDSFMESPLKICGEIQLRIRHQLLGNAGDLTQVKKVLGHGQSLAQCRRWLMQNLPQVETESVPSNAEAAQRAAGNTELAAIASSAAGEIYRVRVLAADIEDHPGNVTRFLVIGDQHTRPSGNDKTSLVVSSRNRPGALFRLLSPIAENGVSMTRIESRPSRQGLWEYVFYIDIEGHADDDKVQTALDQLEDEAALMKRLGSYPRAVL